MKANTAFTSIFMVFVALVRFYLLHNFNKADLLKKERGKREASRKDSYKRKSCKTSLKYVINISNINSVISRAAVRY